MHVTHPLTVRRRERRRSRSSRRGGAPGPVLPCPARASTCSGSIASLGWQGLGWEQRTGGRPRDDGTGSVMIVVRARECVDQHLVAHTRCGNRAWPVLSAGWRTPRGVLRPRRPDSGAVVPPPETSRDQRRHEQGRAQPGHPLAERGECDVAETGRTSGLAPPRSLGGVLVPLSRGRTEHETCRRPTREPDEPRQEPDHHRAPTPGVTPDAVVAAQPAQGVTHREPATRLMGNSRHSGPRCSTRMSTTAR
jgi:hypothetical protein